MSSRRGLASLVAVCWPALSLAQAGFPAAVTGAPLSVQAGATVNHDTVTVGDVIVLTVRVRAPLGATVNFPAAADSLGPVQSLEPPVVRNGRDSVSAADRIATYRLAAWDVGAQPIKLEDVLVQSEQGDRRVAIPLPSLFVRSVLPADTTLRIPKPARPLLALRIPAPWWWWLVAALAIAALGTAFWWWRRRRAQLVPRTGNPYGDAIAAFARVERLGLVAAGELGRHAALTTDVARRYLADRIADVSLAQTSRELLAVVRAHPTVPFDRLHQLLEDVDPVKFARQPLDAARARALGDAAKAVVEEEHTAEVARAAAAARAAESDADTAKAAA